MRLKFYAALFGVVGCVLPRYGPNTRFLVAAGTFADALAAGPRPRLNLNHEPALPLDAYRLDVWEDAVGLGVAADVADDVVSAVLAKALRAGRVNGASFDATGDTRIRLDRRYGCWVREAYRAWRLNNVCLCVGDTPPAVADTRRHVQIWN